MPLHNAVVRIGVAARVVSRVLLVDNSGPVFEQCAAHKALVRSCQISSSSWGVCNLYCGFVPKEATVQITYTAGPPPLIRQLRDVSAQVVCRVLLVGPNSGLVFEQCVVHKAWCVVSGGGGLPPRLPPDLGFSARSGFGPGVFRTGKRFQRKRAL